MRPASWILSLSLAACSAEAGEPSVPRIPVTVDTAGGPVIIQAEIADEPDERTQGLMFRTSLGHQHGMLFVFPVEGQQSFWMKNTLISLDLIFIRADRTILGIVHEAEPETLTPRRVEGASQFVLEVEGGEARRLGFAPDQKVRFMVPPADR
ncbi:MAG: DUF192 domain-containing protein [Myxococcota bacterium]